MKKTNVLFLACIAAAASIGAGALYLWMPSSSPKNVAAAPPGESKFRTALAEKRTQAERAAAARAAYQMRPKAQAPHFFQLAQKLPVPLPEPVPAGIDPKALPKPKRVLSTTVLDKSTIPNLATLRKGQVIGLPLPDGRSYDGMVNLVKPGQGGALRAGGSLMPASEGTFALSQYGATWKGLVRLPAENLAFVIDTWADGRVLMQEHLLSDLECLGIPGNGAAGMAVAAGNVAQGAVPLLNSLPGAAGVLYLDFDGETVVDPHWNGGQTIIASAPIYNGQPLTNQHITQVWQAVAEDFSPFNVTVTTDRALYDATAPGQRMRCIVTPTQAWYSNSVGGVALLNSFDRAGTNFDDEVPCWCFGMYDPASMALVISHEIGHTFGLSHDGRDPNPATTGEPGELEYYSGHGTGDTSWGPIMGSPYNRTMTQWSKGEYPQADNDEDDVDIIANPINNVGFVTDDALNAQPGTEYQTPDGTVSINGILSSSTDADFYKIQASAAPLNITCAPKPGFPNADITLTLFDEGGVPLASHTPDLSLSANVTFTLVTPGTYYLEVTASGNGTPSTGYTEYGSIGQYVITGTFTTVPSTPVFTIQPLPFNAIEGATVTLTAKAITTGGVGYQWFKNGVAMDLIPAFQGPTLKLTGVKAAQAGLYKLLATNASDTQYTKFSEEVEITVNQKPKITTPPKAATVTAGSPHTFNVTATGSLPLTYVWERNNVPLGPAEMALVLGVNNIQLTLPDVQLADAGNYRVKVTNGSGTTVTSSAAALKVDAPPIITVHPVADSAIAPGGSVSLKVTAIGKTPFTYKWFKDNVEIPKAKTNTYAAKEAGTYHVQVFNAIGGPVGTESNDAVVVVNAKPVITLQPVAPAVTPTGGVTLVELTVAATGGGTLLYQWQKDGKNISLADNATANSPTLVFDPISWTHRGAYKCLVSNRVGSASSKAVTLKVDSSPIIITQPANPSYGSTNGAATLTVVAGGDPTLKYQWYLNGTAPANMIAKATSAKLSLSKAAVVAGMYICRVTNGRGSVDTVPAELIIEDLPKVTDLTSDKVVNNKHPVVINGSIELLPTTSGPIISYQWMKGGKALAGQTGPTLTLSPAQMADTGSYTVQVANHVGKATSKGLTVAVLVPPSIYQEPVGVPAIEASPVSLTVKSSGSTTLKYVWEKLLSGTFKPVPGKTGSTMTFASITPNDAGIYRCTVSNDVGTDISREAEITVQKIPEPAISGFLPARAKAGELVRLTGSNLQYYASVKFGTTQANVKMISDSELLLTVPTIPTGTAVEISVTNKGQGGTVSSGTARTFTRTTSYSNDARVDARIMDGTTVNLDGDNFGFTNGDYYDYQYASAWYWWIAPRAGTYRLQVVEGFDSVLVVYTGRPDTTPPNLGYVGYTDGTWGAGETTNITATAGQSFLFQVSSWYSGIQGPFMVYLSPVSFAMATPDTVENTAPQAPAGQATPEAVRFGAGGVANVEPLALADKQITGEAGAGTVRAYFKMGLETGEGEASGDSFQWMLHDQKGAALAGLNLNAADGSLELVGADGGKTPLQGVIAPGALHKVEFILDQTKGSWGARLDGQTLFSDQPIPAGAVFDRLSPVWTPAAGSAHATLIVDDIRILGEPPEGGK